MQNDNPGLILMQGEMARQRQDALATLDACRPAAALIAARVRTVGRIVLYGMGGSHHVNRIAETLYLDAGIDTRAIVVSEALLSPPPDEARVALITSQSGRSGEICALLQRSAGREERFGITLEPDGPLARSTPASLVAIGGSEQAFAASRSIILSLAMHGAILEALGSSQRAARDVLAAAPGLAAEAAPISTLLGACEPIVFAGRHVMRGAAESEALSMMELARVATLAFEGGQFRHGPFEFLRPGIGVVLLRSAGPDASGIEELARTASDAGCVTAIVDSSGLAPVATGRTHRLPAAAGLAAALQTLLFLQEVNVQVARRRIPRGVGSPLRTAKVTL
jgi:fructoselysine-6-P-deglycase FrlB-like protein